MTIRGTALLPADTLTAYLRLKLPHRRTDALRRIAEVLLGIIQAESTLHRKIAPNRPRSASLDSRTRVVARVFHDAQFTPQDVRNVLRRELPEGKLTLVMDRTTWHSGTTPLNILVLDVALGGAVLPLMWTVLPHQGNSPVGARVLLVSNLLRGIPAKRWAVLIADREFIGEDRGKFMRWKGVRMCLRIRENTRTDDELAHDQFLGLKSGEVSVGAGLSVWGMDAGVQASSWALLCSGSGGYPVCHRRQGDHHLGLTRVARSPDLPETVEPWMLVLRLDSPWSESGGDPHDRSRSNFQAVRSAVHGAGLDTEDR